MRDIRDLVKEAEKEAERLIVERRTIDRLRGKRKNDE